MSDIYRFLKCADQMQYTTKAFDSHEEVEIICCDLNKAFDTIAQWSESSTLTTVVNVNTQVYRNMLLTHPFTVQEINNLLSENFIRIFGNIVEHYPAAAIGILKNRPFSNVNDIIHAVFDYLDSLKILEKEKILQLYPDFLNKLSYLSQLPLENEITGTDHLSVEEKRKLRELNNRYKEKFGFPFIIGSKEKYIFTIFSEIVSRLQNDKETEIQIAIKEVKNNVKLRIHEIAR